MKKSWLNYEQTKKPESFDNKKSKSKKVTYRIKAMTTDDFYKSVKYYKGVDFGKFFTHEDVKKILDGLVKTGLLKYYEYSINTYSYVPRKLPNTE